MAEHLSSIRLDLDTTKIHTWRSIITLVVFVITNIIVLLPFHIPIYIPRLLRDAILDALGALRVIGPRRNRPSHVSSSISVYSEGQDDRGRHFVRFRFPMNFVTAPLIADLFLLAILAIGREEVYGGTIGANNISPIDIMAFFITLAYIAISIDASGLIRYLAFKVLQKAGKVGHRLFFYLYAFFFALGIFIGNDPIILSGTAFLAYMTRVSSNIIHPRAWIFTQFAIANVASAVLVSSNPTNLVLAGAFNIKFIDYTAHMIVPVVITAIVLFPFLLYIVFADESLIPLCIKMHELSEEAKARKPVNPNIPHARGNAEEDKDNPTNGEQEKLLSLEEIMNPFLDKGGAAFGGVIMAATLITLLALNASTPSTGEHPVFYVTLPAAFVMFCWDIGFGWHHRRETRQIARDGRREFERARAERLAQEEAMERAILNRSGEQAHISPVPPRPTATLETSTHCQNAVLEGIHYTTDPPSGDIKAKNSLPTDKTVEPLPQDDRSRGARPPADDAAIINEKQIPTTPNPQYPSEKLSGLTLIKNAGETSLASSEPEAEAKLEPSCSVAAGPERRGTTLVSLVADAYRWSQETFPTATAVLSHLPYALVPFAFSMFILVQALVTKGWVPVFAYGWDHWVNKTGTVGSVGGMAFLSVILCNFAGTNIGTTILLSRVIQAWQQIHEENGTRISDRTFWATVYSMALGVNYGAFSTAFSASLAGLLWRDILARKHIHVRGLDFARVNLPIITISMVVGCAVLIGEVYIVKSDVSNGP
ncbi:hypothetical protein GGS23DRAFT_598974 [Durotheca rogersii]|uniref:uncharacterized protein n=1 Tax=Durotheca rogersii TaxID=419775 RepID=UPI00221FF40E|nr:uncharacterized protein GGS23DRAFT_598974 [Durotheca rogersii]KAI5861097.1 hypothetical protein GGS23DRAFT_598974 [Durotheca rogersii]